MYFKTYTLLLCLLSLELPLCAADFLEVKPQREAIVRIAPSGEATEITRLPAGTRVTRLGETERWYSIQMADGNNGWAHKPNLAVVTPTASSST